MGMADRNIIEVINEIKNHISEKQELVTRLDKIIDSVYYTAPEAMYLRWNQLAELLSYHYPAPLQNQNELKIVSIFTTMSEEEVKIRFTDNTFEGNV